MSRCNISCFEPDAFCFEGADRVTRLIIQENVAPTWPDDLLECVPRPEELVARHSRGLKTLPQELFATINPITGDREPRTPDLDLIYFTGTMFQTSELPHDLLTGLSKTSQISISGYFGQPSIKELPSLNGLNSLKTLLIFNLVSHSSLIQELPTSIEYFVYAGTSIGNVPSLEGMRSLVYLDLSRNAISQIKVGDFDGATKLAILRLNQTPIFQIDIRAFWAPDALRTTQDQLEPTADLFGIPNSFPQKAGFLKPPGDIEWARIPIAFQPPYIKCEWIGPFLHNISCGGCPFGSGESDSNPEVCVKASEFRPWKPWSRRRSPAHARFEGAVPSTISRGVTMHIPAPDLGPKNERFVGYQKDFTKIKYNLDFSESLFTTELGCGTSVSGDTTNDAPIGFDKDDDINHPFNIPVYSDQVRELLGTGEPKTLYSYPRHFRIDVTKPGSVSFEGCTSSTPVSMMLFRRFEPNSAAGMKTYDVRIHKNDKVVRILKMGLEPLLAQKAGKPAKFYNIDGSYGHTP